MRPPITYVSGPYPLRPVLRQRSIDLEILGYEVQARWLIWDLADVERHECAAKDLEDVKRCDVFVMVTPGVFGRHDLEMFTGGRHVETGAAIAWGKRVVVVGALENVFHAHQSVERVPTWPDALRHLATIRRGWVAA